MAGRSRLTELLRTEVATRADHPDPSLRGRRYAIPYRRVWQEASRLAEGHRRWKVRHADEQDGRLEAEARTLVFRFVDDVDIRIRLDPEAQTRVDMTSRSRCGNGDLGVNSRRIRRYLRSLDRALDAGPDDVLDPADASGPVTPPPSGSPERR